MVGFNRIGQKEDGHIQGIKPQLLGSSGSLLKVLSNPALTSLFSSKTKLFGLTFSDKVIRTCSENMRLELEEHNKESKKADRASTNSRKSRIHDKVLGMTRYLRYANKDMQKKTGAFARG
jgi:hypothetical protein